MSQSNFIDCLILAVDSHIRGEQPNVQIVPKGDDADFTHALRLFGAEALKAHADPFKQTELHIRHARIDKRVRMESIAEYIAKQRPWLSSATNELLVLEAKPITIYELDSWDKQPMPSGNPFEPVEVYDDNTVEPDSSGVTIAEARAQISAQRGSEGPTIAERRAEIAEAREADVEFDDDEGLTIAERRAEVAEERGETRGYASSDEGYEGVTIAERRAQVADERADELDDELEDEEYDEDDY